MSLTRNYLRKIPTYNISEFGFAVRQLSFTSSGTETQKPRFALDWATKTHTRPINQVDVTTNGSDRASTEFKLSPARVGSWCFSRSFSTSPPKDSDNKAREQTTSTPSRSFRKDFLQRTEHLKAPRDVGGSKTVSILRTRWPVLTNVISVLLSVPMAWALQFQSSVWKLNETKIMRIRVMDDKASTHATEMGIGGESEQKRGELSGESESGSKREEKRDGTDEEIVLEVTEEEYKDLLKFANIILEEGKAPPLVTHQLSVLGISQNYSALPQDGHYRAEPK